MSEHTLSLLCSDSVCAPPFHSLREGGREGGRGGEKGGRKEGRRREGRERREDKERRWRRRGSVRVY